MEKKREIVNNQINSTVPKKEKEKKIKQNKKETNLQTIEVDLEFRLPIVSG